MSKKKHIGLIVSACATVISVMLAIVCERIGLDRVSELCLINSLVSQSAMWLCALTR